MALEDRHCIIQWTEQNNLKNTHLITKFDHENIANIKMHACHLLLTPPNSEPCIEDILPHLPKFHQSKSKASWMNMLLTFPCSKLHHIFASYGLIENEVVSLPLLEGFRWLEIHTIFASLWWIHMKPYITSHLHLSIIFTTLKRECVCCQSIPMANQA